MARGTAERASKKNLVVFLFGDVLGYSFFFILKTCNVFVTILYRFRANVTPWTSVEALICKGTAVVVSLCGYLPKQPENGHTVICDVLFGTLNTCNSFCGNNTCSEWSDHVLDIKRESCFVT